MGSEMCIRDREKPKPLASRANRTEVVERINNLGAVLTPLDEGTVISAIDKLLGNGVEAIAVSLINAYTNGEHERRIGELIAERAPDLSICLSSAILPEIKEYERTSTVVVNAYILPVVARYLTALSTALKRLDVAAPLLVMQSSGGAMGVEAACLRPIHIIESGPAGKAGIEAEDVIVKVGDHEVKTSWDLRSRIANTPPNQEVPVVAVRKGEILHVTVLLEERTLEQELETRTEGISPVSYTHLTLLTSDLV